MSTDYTSKTVLITGAASGLGLSLTRHFLAANATVLALDVSDASLASLPSKFDDAPDLRARLHPVKADITDPASVSAAISSWIDGGGGDEGARRLDVLVNNAGISDLMHPTGECPMDMWDRQILVNMTGSFVTSQRAIQQFLKQEPIDGQRGVILNVISAAGVHGARAANHENNKGVAYTASKHGTVGLTRSTAAFYGPKGIRCLAIMPGPMMTNMARDEEHIKEFHPEGLAMGNPAKGGWDLGWSPLDQVSKTVVNLCSGGMNTINGALVPTDMGWTTL
ncbi:bacilysin biosynthesis oxidoreductase bacC [Colletotrichum scovillei]|uniref:Bacilysin biosynthesis oxidoreductase bacC n=1 Tax=Colletotrichum scovillei TaxID=1209932 RepID=A0A9P7R9Z8_9PEZI|nr:bacilysin biosynthesis oxidoreductase bacC [Colletotrichum scovillei]KAG7071077.1 bacilysin biosynthesis oxidoreductase bacC [Colletotrichum scovillei]KAG7079319.1 bacilysin biosynthesis oxidoreductase bacC [Colletotrichum scovillei]